MRSIISRAMATLVAAVALSGAVAGNADACCKYNVNAHQRFVFAMNRSGSTNLYTMFEDGSLAQLTSHPGYEGQPSFNRDRTKVAFVAEFGGPRAIWIMNTDRTGLRRVVTPMAGYTDKAPSLSPDGTRIVFASNRGGGPFRLWTVKADGTYLVKLTGLGPRPNANTHDIEPAWSPDGTKVAFTTGRFTGVNEIAVTGFPGGDRYSDPQRVSYDPGQEPAWSPDGTRIAFATNHYGGGRWQIATQSASYVNVPTIVANMTVDTTDPTWSPDGTRILFTTRGGLGPLYSANANGSGNYRSVMSNGGYWIGSAHWGYAIQQTLY